MADKVIRGGRAGADYDGDYVSAVAGEVADWGVVFEYGDAWVDRTVFRDGDCEVDIVLRDGFCGAAGVVAVSESV